MYEIRLPLPPPNISPNRKRGAHWSAYSSDEKAAKESAYYEALNAFPVARGALSGVKVVYDLIVHYESGAQMHDEDNAVGWMKQYLDGLALYFSKGQDKMWRRGGCYLGHAGAAHDSGVVIRLWTEE